MIDSYTSCHCFILREVLEEPGDSVFWMAAHDETPLCEKCGAEVSGAPNAGVFGLRPSRMVYERLIERSKKPSPWYVSVPCCRRLQCAPHSSFIYVSIPIVCSFHSCEYFLVCPFCEHLHLCHRFILLSTSIIYHVKCSLTVPFGVSLGTATGGRILSKSSCRSSFSWKKKRTTAALSGKESKLMFYNELAALDVCLGQVSKARVAFLLFHSFLTITHCSLLFSPTELCFPTSPSSCTSKQARQCVQLLCVQVRLPASSGQQQQRRQRQCCLASAVHLALCGSGQTVHALR